MTTARLPRITCQTCCTGTEAEHQADLDNWEERVIHHGVDTPDGWHFTSITSVDGQLSPLTEATRSRSAKRTGGRTRLFHS